MANQKGRKPSSRKKTVEKDEGLKPYQDEIVILSTLIFCILLILSNLKMCGIFGKLVSSLFFGLFGFMNYILPFGIFIGMAFYLSNRGNRKAKRKLISIIILMTVFMALLQLAYSPSSKESQLIEYYKVSSKSRMGGGLIGGIISGALYQCFDTIASVIILIGIGLLLCMFITEKLIFAPMGKRGYQKVRAVKENRRIQREEHEQYQSDTRELPVKRKAKTFTIERDPVKTIQTKEKEVVDKNGEIQTRKQNKKGKIRKKKTSVDMEEITPSGLENLNIVRAKAPENTDSIPVYEEELLNKFNPVHAKMQTDIEDVQTSKAKEKKDSANQPTKKVIEEAALKKPFDNTWDKKAINLNKQSEKKMEGESMHLNFEAMKSSDEAVNYDAVEPADSIEPSKISKNEKIVRKNEIDPANAKSAARLNTPIHETVKRTASKKAKEDGSEITNMASMNVDVPLEIPYQCPSTSLLTKPKNVGAGMTDEELKRTAWKLHQTLESFGVKVTIDNVSCGPSVTRYELHPEQGVKVSKITGLADDIKLNLAAADVRIEAPIPGKAAVGIEVPNKENVAVMLRELLESSEFAKHASNVAFAVGKDIAGKTVVTDIAKMPHLLIAGATGSGKSVCINTLIMSIIYKAHPDDVKLIMIDPKVVELSVYNGIPHLLIPVVTDPKKASGALNWAVIEMTERYQKFAELGVRDLKGYNAKIEKVTDLEPDKYKKMPQIIIIVDELADLMMVAPGEVEESICRLAQLARAAGIHLVIATQRPSVNVITGVIKANIPSRIAFSVSSAVDSRTIIDSAGAEKLLGKGDMLFYPAGFAKPIRVQGAFVSDQEVSAVVEFLTRDSKSTYDNTIVEKISAQASTSASGGSLADDRDEYFLEAAKFIIEKDKASIGMLQRVFKIGFNRASRIMDQLYEAGVVGAEEGTKPRKVTMSMEQFEEYIEMG